MNEKINNLLRELDNVRKSGDGWQACCPAHDDNKASLSIAEGDRGNILLYCHAGCDYQDVLKALKEKNPNLLMFQDRSNANSRIIKEYKYLDENEVLLFEVLRYEPKSFRQRRPDGRGGWISNLKGVRRVIYNLPNVIAAVEDNKTIFLVEGEKDADNLIALGLTATTKPMGVGKWIPEYSEHFNGSRVVIIPDNDTPGENHAKQVAKALSGIARSIKVLKLPDLPQKGDVSDWLEAGNTKETLISLVVATSEYLAEEDIEDSDLFRFTDTGNAKRLVSKYGKDIRYCYQNSKWLIWNGIQWGWQEKGEIMQYAKSTVLELFEEAEAISGDYERKMATKFAMDSEGHARLNAMIKLAQSEKGIPIAFNELDTNHWQLNCLNGTIDLKTGEIKDHDRKDLITNLAPVIYDRDAKSEMFDKFLARILPEVELREFVKLAAGYSITGSTQEEKLLFAYGPPATGKSTLFAAISSTLGDYAATTDFEAFLEKKSGSGARNDIARLAGKRFVLGSEIDDGKKMAESLIKQVTGGDLITARFLFQEFFEFRPVFTLWLAANSQPRVSHNDAAMWRRILQLPFRVHIPKEERDPSLKLFLQDTTLGGPAVLAWLVEGCLQWQQTGLVVPEVVEQCTDSYRENMDPIKDFIEDCCIINPLARSNNTLLWEEYETWARDNGEKYTLGRKKFNQCLEERGCIQSRNRNARYWQGIGIQVNEKSRIPRNVTEADVCDTIKGFF